ncbi:uncharacterized protein SPSK_08523 [Sporothrix schenckii 1099-18]|uniref:Uncharacterized protein n=1 Tax=Sporothrix schenckii 1099-18 TaxID=1397361 RepID=A0A0F2M698_SPOSC|nr:uncharacterized protein SPSK_08523 [Sporothrix schenckii 1099-18]KJR84614.1 hypothetical protein SPSK_08523 [Sporothrix schenckii 1099-18]
MASNDGFPTRESVLLAMRNDLGMTRVDDLQLENGHRGHTIRTGNASSMIMAQATATPREILPVASKWKSAIQSGAFDDDDAETVKGLDRIGGGRLHALNNVPTVPAQYFPQRKKLPPGLPPPGLGRNTPFNIQPDPHRPAKSVPGVPFAGFGQQDARSAGLPPGLDKTSALLSFKMPPKSAPKPKGFGTVDSDVVRRLGGDSPMPRRIVQVPENTVRKQTLPEPSSPEVKILRPQDPEPASIVYKEGIRVADRLAKGEGVVYLVALSDSDPGTFHVYLEGSKYLEYPVLKMHNYITNATDLCPQFKESDGVSITTTRLVFGSQDKIAKFMEVLRSLKARKQEHGSEATAASTPAQTAKKAVSISTPPEEPDSSQNIDRGSVLVPSKSAKEDTPGEIAQATYDVKPTSTLPNASTRTISAAESPSADLVLEYGDDDYGMACDLVDLSHPVEVTASRPPTRSTMASSYVMDLGSLQSSHFETPAMLLDVVEGVQEQSTPFVAAGVGALDTERFMEHAAEPGTGLVTELLTDPVAVPVVEPKTEPDMDLSATNHSEHPSLPAEKAPDEAIHRPQGDAFAEDDAMGSKIRLQDSLLEILPKFEAMVCILDSVDEAKRVDTAKLVFSNLRSSLGSKTNVHLSSAEQLLWAILAKLSKEKGTSVKAADIACRLTYTRDNVERLRDRAAPPPEILDKLDFLPRPSRLGRPKASRAQPLHTPSSSLTDNKIRSNLKPTAEPFQPSPPPKMSQTKSTTRLTLTSSTLGMRPATTSPVALSDISNSSIASNIDSLTARMSRLTPPDAPSKTATKGLQGSRWATAGNSVSTENANRFMGIAIPP